MSGSGRGPAGQNATNPLAAAIDSVIVIGIAAASPSAPGTAYVWVASSVFPTVPSGQYGAVLFTGTVSGTAGLPVRAAATVAGTGTDHVLAADAANAFDIRADMARGTMIMQGFDGRDAINPFGYAPDAASTAFNGAQVSAGNTVVMLADNAKILLLGLTALTQSNIVA